MFDEKKVVEQGDTVSVQYTGKLDDGTVFDSSQDRDPLTFDAGVGQMIPGFDQAVMGMAVGDKKSVSIPPDQAYGQRRDQLVHSIPKSQLDPESVKQAAVGQQVSLVAGDGRSIPATISEITDETITLDLNHELAGQTLNFDIEVVKLEKK